MAKLSPAQKGLITISAFRKQMSASLVLPALERYFSIYECNTFQKDFELHVDFIKKDLINKDKLNFVKSSLKFNKIFERLGIVKYIGISGSFAARTFIEGEDLDLFFVVANDTAWIYRGLLKLFLGNRGRLYEDHNIADSLCVNFIVEERAVNFEPDIFTFHELIHLVDIYNPEYKQQMISANNWMSEEYGVELSLGLIPKIKRNILWMPINYLAFQLQVFFMKLMKHKPSLDRIKKNFRKGEIAFYPENFRDSIREAYEREYKSLLKVLPTSSTSTANSTSTKASATTKTTTTSKSTT